MECVGKTCCAATESAACRKNFVLSSLILLGISACDFHPQTASTLELAKGFEPPTL